DPAIARQQIEYLQVVLAYITNTRQDTVATDEEKLKDLMAIEEVDIDPGILSNIIQLDDYAWESVQQEALRVLEQIMRNVIQDDRVPDAQRNVPSMVSFSLPNDQAEIVSELVTLFIIPNSLYSDELTSEAREQAIMALKPIASSYIEGETIVSRGEIITPLIYEALQEYELVKRNNDPKLMVASGILVCLIITFILLYFRGSEIQAIHDLRSLVMICLMFVLFLLGIRTLNPNQEFMLYLYPISAFGLTVSFLYHRDIAIMVTIVLGILAAYGMPNSLNLTLFYILSSVCGILVLGKGRRIARFFWAGFAVGSAGIATILAYRLADTGIEWIDLAAIIGAAIGNGIASASLTLLFQFLFAQLLGITTPLRLLDISRPDHPLLQLMLREAPGTYQHSLQVANLAEQAAEAIGTDTMLVRVGATYHDAGKALNPSFFIENKMSGMKNPHDELDPETSAGIILNHIRDGIALARKFHLPPRIQDFILEHHGRLLTNYQYATAVKAAGDNPDLVDQEIYRYPGPAPQSKETALLMLADGVEARARALLPKDEEELSALVRKTIEYLRGQGQFDETNLTLKDLYLITESFVKTLRNTHHIRIQYPEIKNHAEPKGEDQGNNPIESEDLLTSPEE
ncbi:MAG: HDIG domain-containing protein, partial [Anaerolineaceae bacterium]|nr:HDIG domain-containing protein [Anaerolineaceae bacterium]